MSENVIVMRGIKKKYHLGMIGARTLQGELQSKWARFLGRDDPNTKIGTDQRLIGEEFMALNGIDLTIRKGETVGIIGRNGAGKSTLLKLLSRVTAPTEGTIDIYGRITSMLEVGTGFNGEMTGRENIYMNGAILGMSKAEIDNKMDRIIEFSEIGGFIDTPVKRYSSGMYVKLAFSVSAYLDSEIMIMDEVLAVGDLAFQQKCINKMSDSSKSEGKTVLYVSHNMDTIRNLCNRCVVLDEGRIIFDGSVEDGIRVYMRVGQEENLLVNCSGDKRPQWLRNQTICITELELVDKKDNIYIFGESLILRIKWQNLENVECLGLRIEFRNLQNQSVGTSLLQDFYSGSKGQIEDKCFELDIDNLVDASYTVRVLFFRRNEYGYSENCDFAAGPCIRLTGRNRHNGLEWMNSKWGYCQLSDPKEMK